MLKILELAMNGGWDPVGRRHIGPQTKTLDQCETFEEFYGLYKLHLDYYISAEARFEKYEYEKTAQLHSFLYVTMLYDGAAERGKVIFDGGCASLNGTLEVYGLVNKVGLDTYLAVVINNDQNTTLARYAGASPDGRKAGTPYANANNPAWPAGGAQPHP